MKLIALLWGFALSITSLATVAAPFAPEVDKNLRVQFVLSSELYGQEESLSLKCRDLVLFSLSGPGVAIPHCRFVNSSTLQNMMEGPKSVLEQAQMHIFVWQDLGGDYHLHLRNNSLADSQDFDRAEWRIKAVDSFKEKVKWLVHNAIAFDYSKDSLRRFFLEIGSVDSKEVSYQNGEFRQIRSNQKIPWKTAYNIFVTEGQKNKNFMRTALELTLALGAGITWYFQNLDFNGVDFDYPNYKNSMKTRFTSFDAVRFDNNGAGINKKHLYPAGLSYYLIARSNNLSQAEAYLASFVTSTLWEYFIEYREVVSINDLVMTPAGGAVLGETIYQLTRLFKKPGIKNQIISTALNPFEAFHQWLDNMEPNRRLRNNDFGFDANIFAKFDVFAMKTSGKDAGSAKTFNHTFWGVDAEILNVPLEPGKSQGFIYDGAITEALLRISADKNSVDDFKVAVKTSLFLAYQATNLNYNKDGNLEGYRFVVGPTQALNVTFDKNRSDGTYKDMIMNVQVVGGTMDVTRYYQNFKLRMTIDIFPNFAMLRSYAFDEYRRDHDVSEVQSTLVNDSTYYAYGYTTGVKLRAGYSDVEIGASFQNDQFYGFNKRTRFFERETSYLDLSDRRQTQDYSAQWNITEKGKIRCGVEFDRRKGTVQAVSPLPRKEKTTYCAVSYSFL